MVLLLIADPGDDRGVGADVAPHDEELDVGSGPHVRGVEDVAATPGDGEVRDHLLEVQHIAGHVG